MNKYTDDQMKLAAEYIANYSKYTDPDRFRFEAKHLDDKWYKAGEKELRGRSFKLLKVVTDEPYGRYEFYYNGYGYFRAVVYEADLDFAVKEAERLEEEKQTVRITDTLYYGDRGTGKTVNLIREIANYNGPKVLLASSASEVLRLREKAGYLGYSEKQVPIELWADFSCGYHDPTTRIFIDEVNYLLRAIFKNDCSSIAMTLSTAKDEVQTHECLKSDWNL